MTSRTEFIALAGNEGVNRLALACRFGISRKPVYKRLARAKPAGRPQVALDARAAHPRAQDWLLEQAVVDLRWGGRKLGQVLIDRGHTAAPATSTITHALSRHGLMAERAAAGGVAWQHFEHNAPSDLWEKDTKGTVALSRGRCDPLTVPDDYARYDLTLAATIPDMAARRSRMFRPRYSGAVV